MGLILQILAAVLVAVVLGYCSGEVFTFKIQMDSFFATIIV